MAAAQTEAPTPQLEARLRHSLPFTPDLVVGCGEGVIAGILGGVHVPWDYRTVSSVRNGNHRNWPTLESRVYILYLEHIGLYSPVDTKSTLDLTQRVTH